MNASADIQTETHTNVLSVPINAVTTRDKTDSTGTKTKKTGSEESSKNDTDDLDVVVFVVGADNKVKKVMVETSIQDLNHIEITSGLKEGDEVVSGPYDVVSKTLKDGSEVKKVEKKELFEKKD